MSPRACVPRAVHGFALCTLGLFTLFIALPAFSVTIHVPADEPTIQSGIDAASAGDTVLVACGTYYEHSIIMKSGVCLRSETGQADCVVIDEEQQDDVMVFSHGTAPIAGFTMTGCSPDGPAALAYGSCSFMEVSS